jgi:hypothetical protein
MAKPGKGKVVAIDAGASSRRANRQGPANSLQSQTQDPSDQWSEIVDALAGFVWSNARAGRVSGKVAAEVFRIAWLRFADQFTDVRADAVEIWLKQTVAHERIRIAVLRTGPLDLDLWYKRYE